jgi:hypothetical protein
LTLQLFIPLMTLDSPDQLQVFEPSEIQERHLGFADDLIRLRDIPERHQLLNSTLSSQPTYVPDPFPKFPSPKLAARWISTRLSARTKAYFLPSSNDMYAEPSKYAELYSYFIRAIQRSLEFMFEQQLEVPFVYEHRRDYINHILADDGTDLANWEEHTLALLTRDELWKVYDLGLKYRSLHERREGLNEIWHKKLVPRLARDDEGDDSDGMDIDEGDDANGNPVRKKGDPRRTYFEEHVLGSPGTAEEGVEGVVDALEYLRSAFAKEMRELKEEEEELRKEGDVRVHKKPTGTGGKYGLDKLRETRLSQFIKVRFIVPLRSQLAGQIDTRLVSALTESRHLCRGSRLAQSQLGQSSRFARRPSDPSSRLRQRVHRRSWTPYPASSSSRRYVFGFRVVFPSLPLERVTLVGG